VSGAPTVTLERLPHAAGLPLPSYATAGSAGADLRAAIDGEMWIAAGERRAVPTGFRISIPPGYEGEVRPRSGLALRHGVTLPNSPGTIDSDYRGELQVLLVNLSSRPFRVRRGDRIAQLLVRPVATAKFEEHEALPDTDRGAGGFGSTGRS